jgi:hypothetical protein
VTGRELQQQHHHKNHHSHSHSHSHNQPAAGPNANAASSVGGDDGSVVINAAGASSATSVPGMLLYAANERPRLAAYRQVQELMQQQQQQQRQQQPRRRWKPAAAAPAGAASSTANGASDTASHLITPTGVDGRKQQQQIQLVPQRDIEAQADNALPMQQQQSTAAAAAAAAAAATSNAGAAAGPVANAGQRQAWRWWGLRLHDIGFMASFLQLIGATIFWVRKRTCSYARPFAWVFGWIVGFSMLQLQLQQSQTPGCSNIQAVKELMLQVLNLLLLLLLQVPCIFGAPTAYPAENISNYRTWDGVYW